LISGAGLLVYQFAFNKNSKSFAKNELKNKEEVKPADSGKTILPEIKTNDSNLTSTANGKQQKNNEVAVNDKTAPGRASRQTTSAGSIKKDSIVYNNDLNNEPTAAFKTPSKSADDKTVRNSAIKDEKKEIAKEEAKTLTNKAKQNASAVPQQNEAVFYKESAATDRKAGNQNSNTNIFRGRITDANNNPIPFANVTNPADNVGTYSDAKGYFNLTSPDSVLDVQIRSIGFENVNARLKNNVSNNQVVMQDDRRSLSEVVISNKKPNAAARSRGANIKVEEPEPADGWINYDTYLVNNLNMPD